MKTKNNSSEITRTEAQLNRLLEAELAGLAILDDEVEVALTDAQRFACWARRRELDRARAAERFAPQRAAERELQKVNRVFAAWSRS